MRTQQQRLIAQVIELSMNLATLHNQLYLLGVATKGSELHKQLRLTRQHLGLVETLVTQKRLPFPEEKTPPMEGKLPWEA